MSTCAVFANIKDLYLSDEQKDDINRMLDRLYSFEAVRTIFTADWRLFDHLCDRWAEMKSNEYSQIRVYRYPKSFNPYRKYFSNEKQALDIFFADFILCDNTTIDFVKKCSDKGTLKYKCVFENAETGIYVMKNVKE